MLIVKGFKVFLSITIVSSNLFFWLGGCAAAPIPSPQEDTDQPLVIGKTFQSHQDHADKDLRGPFVVPTARFRHYKRQMSGGYGMGGYSMGGYGTGGYGMGGYGTSGYGSGGYGMGGYGTSGYGASGYGSGAYGMGGGYGTGGYGTSAMGGGYGMAGGDGTRGYGPGIASFPGAYGSNFAPGANMYAAMAPKYPIAVQSGGTINGVGVQPLSNGMTALYSPGGLTDDGKPLDTTVIKPPDTTLSSIAKLDFSQWNKDHPDDKVGQDQ